MCYLVGLGSNKTSDCKRSTSCFGWPGLLQNLYNSPSVKSFNSPGTKLTTIFLITRKRKLCSHYCALRSTHVVGKNFWNRGFANYFEGILCCFVIKVYIHQNEVYLGQSFWIGALQTILRAFFGVLLLYKHQNELSHDGETLEFLDLGLHLNTPYLE